MKKLLLATAVAALSVSAAHAAPTVYGKAFLTADYQDYSKGDFTGIAVVTDANGNPVPNAAGQIEYYGPSYTGTIESSSNTSLNSTGSKIGIKGAEALTANTDLVYQLEYGVEIDDAEGGTNKGKNQDQFYARDTYLGLSNKQYGTALAGRLTTIDDMVNYANVTAGGVLGGDDVLASFSAPRANNAFAYVSPSYNGAQLLAMYGLDSDQDANSLADHEQAGVGVKYEPANQPFRAGLTYITAGDALKATRVSGAYDVTPALTVGALYQLTDVNSDDNENAFALSASYKTATPWTVYGQADLVNNVLGLKDAERQRYVVGGKYAFNANTTGHVYAAYMNDDKVGSAYTYEAATSTGYATDFDRDSQDGFGIGTGIEYKF